MESLKTVSFKGWDNCTFLVETIILVSLSLTKKMVGDYINGQASSPTCTKVSLSKEKGMVEVPSGGPMEVGMKVNSGMGFKAVMESFIEMVVTLNTKDLGIMECSMARVLNSSKMDKNMKDRLNRINSMEMEYSIRMIQ